MTEHTIPAAGTDDRPPLTDHTVTVTLSHRNGDHRDTRAFTLVIPAIGVAEAQRAGIDIGLAINEATGYQWKLADGDEGPTVDPADDDPEPVHGYFGLTYANYLVLQRTLMQSMPLDWQRRMVACLREADEAFAHIEHPPAYKVEAAREVEYSALTSAEAKALGVTWDEQTGKYHDPDGTEHDGWERTLVPIADPIPHYNRGRTHIEPRPTGAAP